MQNEPTTFEERTIKNQGSLPSITFCEDSEDDDFTTMQDILDAMDKIKHKSNAYISFMGKGIDYEKVDLKDSTALSNRFNVTLDDIWSFTATVSQFHVPNIFVCSSANLDFLKVPEQGRVNVNTNSCSEDKFTLRFEKHQPGQSLYNFQFDYNNGYQYYRQGIFQYKSFITVKTESLKTSTFDCYEDNSMKMTECIDEYIAEQLNCSLPWAKPLLGYDICNPNEKLEKFRNIHGNITAKASILNLTRKGCFKPNCLQTTWQDSYVAWGSPEPNCSMVSFGLLSSAITIQREEILLADFSTFVVDCGSYLGLFLGASILSLTDSALAYVFKAGVSFCRQ